jgi:hypothetical protein
LKESLFFKKCDAVFFSLQAPEEATNLRREHLALQNNRKYEIIFSFLNAILTRRAWI